MRKRVGAGYVAAAVLPVFAVAIIGTHIAGAQSRWVGLAIYGLGWVSMILAIRNHPRAANVVRRGQGAGRHGLHLSDSTIWTWVEGEGFRWRKQESWFHEPEKHDPEFAEKRG